MSGGRDYRRDDEGRDDRRRRDGYEDRRPAERRRDDDYERPREDRRRYDEPDRRRKDNEDDRRPAGGRRDNYDQERRAPARSGGWGEEERPRNNKPSGGWGEEAASGGWGEEERPRNNKPSSGGWGEEERPRNNKPSSGGWGEESEPRRGGNQSSGGWGEEERPRNNKPSSGGWGEEERPRNNKPSSGGWGEESEPRRSGGWGEEERPRNNKSSGGWGEESEPRRGGNQSSGGWAEEERPRNNKPSSDWGEESEPRRGGNQGGSGCRVCGEEGHYARECPNKQSSGGGEGCRKCGEQGHFARECPNGSNPDFVPPPRTDRADDHCWRCDGMGHTAQTCPSRIECGNQPGRSAINHNQMYTNNVEEDDEFDDEGFGKAHKDREEELFGTHSNTGIQFSKYKQISVQVFGANVPPPLSTFDDIPLGPVLKYNLGLADWKEPTPIQRYALPIAFAGRDIMGCAQTGSGKTAAFLFPMIHHILKTRPQKHFSGDAPSPLALIAVPVRELAQQIHIEAIKFTYRSAIRSVVVYGGGGSRDQRDALRRGCDILIGTPGRLIDFMNRGEFKLDKIRFLCMDEADRMLDTGFGEDMKQIVQQCPEQSKRQTLMFSATFPEEVQELARKSLKHDHVMITVGRVGAATPTVRQVVLRVDDYDKFEALIDVLQQNPVKTLIFVARKVTAEELKRRLSDKGVSIETIHGDKDQYLREEALDQFKKSKIKVLVATDVAARGLDIPLVKHVINYDLPNNIDDYVHRIGRTGRVGHEGLATSFFNSSNSNLAADLCKVLEEQGSEIEEWLDGYRQQNPTSIRKTFVPKRSFNDSGSRGGGGGDAWGSSGGGGQQDSWGSSGGGRSGGDGGWGGDNKSSGGGGGWGEEDSRPSSSKSKNNDDGWGGDNKKSSGGGGWGEEDNRPSSSKSKNNDDGWGGDNKSSGGGGWGEEEPASGGGGGGWGEEPASGGGGGGWGEEEPASGGGDGW